jgi:4-hydroxythreonine-4-phosphate dehydrogenase
LSDYLPTHSVIIIGNSELHQDKKIQMVDSVDEVQHPGIHFYHIHDKFNGGDESFNYVNTGIHWALDNKVHALVTAPISKEKWLKAGIPYKGHTELLAKTSGVKDFSMFFWSKNLKVALFTIHIPLKQVFSHINQKKVVRFIKFLDSQLLRFFNTKFTFLVSGLNPHSGEGGYLGTEEIEEIIPAIDILRPKLSIQGPFPPDIVFLKAGEIKNSVVVCWYHDQGLIPFKLLNIHSGVNMTVGLPFIRTSPDHGTAKDIAGKGVANPSSMKEAIKLADYLLSQEP